MVGTTDTGTSTSTSTSRTGDGNLESTYDTAGTY